MKWQSEARRLAQATGRDTITPDVFAHLGQVAIVCAAGYDDSVKGQALVRAIRERLALTDARVLAFATDRDGSRWCMIVEDDDEIAVRYDTIAAACEVLGLDEPSAKFDEERIEATFALLTA